MEVRSRWEGWRLERPGGTELRRDGGVVRRSGPKDIAGVPAEVFVEVQRGTTDFAANKEPI